MGGCRIDTWEVSTKKPLTMSLIGGGLEEWKERGREK